MKDWLLRAVCTALDEGQVRLTLDWIQDHAPLVDQYRQMALDATEGEQKLHHTASNREHVWRLLQGGELIAPVPPLPPHEIPPIPSSPPMQSETVSAFDTPPLVSDVTESQQPVPVVKKTRSRKKVEVLPEQDGQGMMVQDADGASDLVDPPKRRRKKTAVPEGEDSKVRIVTSSSTVTEASPELLDAKDATVSSKPKRARRVGEPKPKRYAVGEPETEHNR